MKSYSEFIQGIHRVVEGLPDGFVSVGNRERDKIKRRRKEVADYLVDKFPLSDEKVKAVLDRFEKDAFDSNEPYEKFERMVQAWEEELITEHDRLKNRAD